MRYPPEQKARTRAGIVDVAAREFRLKGYDGIGVDGLAAGAELTAGALYKHFNSKEALFREVVQAGVARLKTGIARFQERQPADWFPALATWYMGSKHRADVSGGCAMPSLSPEVVKADKATKQVYEAGLLEAMAQLTSKAPFDDPVHGRERAWAALALFAGGVTLSRAVASPALAKEIAAAVNLVATENLGRP